MTLRLQLQHRHCFCTRIRTLYQLQDSADIGAKARKERQLGHRQGTAPIIDVVGHKQDLAAELLGRLKE